ncbi:hypothetical protein QTV49_000491 [Vibrio vulnificus]|nr:hypothetical protein [Vibrio vulnificus]
MSGKEELHKLLNKVASTCTEPNTPIEEKHQTIELALDSELTQNYPALTNLLLAIKKNNNHNMIAKISQELVNVVSDEFSLIHNQQLQTEHLNRKISEEIEDTFYFFDKDEVTEQQMDVITQFNEQANKLLGVLAELKKKNPQ